MNFFKKIFRKQEPKDTLMLWGIIEGPFHISTIEDLDGVDEHAQWMLVMKVSEGDEVSTKQVWFETYEDTYQLKRHFDKSITPIEVAK